MLFPKVLTATSSQNYRDRMVRKLSLQDLSIQGKRVLLRVDFNVPLEKNGTISDDSRIRATLPTIRYALGQGASVVLISHLGRPKGKKDPSQSLQPCAMRLSELVGQPVKWASECVGPEVERLVCSLRGGEVVLLENLRFHDAEEHPDQDPTFAKQLAKLGDVYVDDAFGAAHRPHASITVITQYFPDRAAMGFLMEKELKFLGEALSHPKRPFYAILGGAKISTKIDLVRTLVDRVDGLFVGGGMAFTFLKAQGFRIGASLCEENCLNVAKETLALFKNRNVPLWLPVDAVIQSTLSDDQPSQSVQLNNGIPDGWRGVDLGPKSIELFRENIKNGATIFWNGPLGVFEIPAFAQGTYAIAETLAALHALTIVGGGDSVAALEQLGLSDKMSHVSTGGGASLEFIEKGTLVGIDALSDHPQ